MGNLLRVLYYRENDSPNRVDIFVDFESKLYATYLVCGISFLVLFAFVGTSASIIFPCSIKIQKTGDRETQPERSTALC